MTASSSARKRRRRASPVRKLRPFWFLVIVVLALGAVGAYFLLSWPALDPHTIEISGNAVVPRADIQARAGINLTQNMWLQNTHAMAARIEAIPYIDRAVVHRRPPDTMTIAVTERTPYAIVRSRAQEVTIDATLRVLQTGAASDTLPLLEPGNMALPLPGATIAGASLSDLAHVADRAAAAHLAVESLGYDRFGDVTMRLRSGVDVLLGDGSDLEKKLAIVEPILTQVHSSGKRITAIDLRAITTPVVVYAKS